MKLKLAIAITSLLCGCSGDSADRFLLSSDSDWSESIARIFGPGRTRVGGFECFDPATGKHDRLQDNRTPQSWWRGGEAISATLTSEPGGRLTAFELWAAYDEDGDGHVAPSEWTLASTSTLVEEEGRTRAELPSAHVARDPDAEWFLVGYRVFGVTDSGWLRSDLTYSDPPSAAAEAARTAGTPVRGPSGFNGG